MKIQAALVAAILLAALLFHINAESRHGALLVLITMFSFGAARCRKKKEGGC